MSQLGKEHYYDFAKIWEQQQGAVMLKSDATGIEWKKTIAEFFYREGRKYYEQERGTPKQILRVKTLQPE